MADILTIFGIKIKNLLGSGARLPQINPNGSLADSGLLLSDLALNFSYNTAYVIPTGSDSGARAGIVGRIDRPFATIQAAVNAIAVGQSIFIHKATYNENIVFKSFNANHGGNVDPYFLNVICEEGTVINGNHTFSTNPNSGCLINMYGRGSWIAATGNLFFANTGSGNAFRIFGAKTFQANGTGGNVGSVFANLNIDMIENVDSIKSGSYIFTQCLNSASYDASLVRHAFNIKYMEAATAIWFGASGSRACLDFDRVKVRNTPYLIQSNNASGAANYYSKTIKNSDLEFSQSLGDAYLGRVEYIRKQYCSHHACNQSCHFTGTAWRGNGRCRILFFADGQFASESTKCQSASNHFQRLEKSIPARYSDQRAFKQCKPGL